MHEVLGEHADFVAVGDVDALAEALRRLPRDRDEAAADRRRRHAAGFSWDRFVAANRAAYDLAIRGR
jgi:glycosyltransferase involved in cell wall biosynthesis